MTTIVDARRATAWAVLHRSRRPNPSFVALADLLGGECPFSRPWYAFRSIGAARAVE
jgi:hypothetical protein